MKTVILLLPSTNLSEDMERCFNETRTLSEGFDMYADLLRIHADCMDKLRRLTQGRDKIDIDYEDDIVIITAPDDIIEELLDYDWVELIDDMDVCDDCGGFISPSNDGDEIDFKLSEPSDN